MCGERCRTQRRHGLPVVNPLVFYPWRAWDFVSVAGKWAALALRYRRILRRVLADKDGAAYMDEALKPATEVDHDTISSPATPTRSPTPTARRSGSRPPRPS